MTNYPSWPLDLPCGVMLLNRLYKAAMRTLRKREVSDWVASVNERANRCKGNIDRSGQ
jgi:hypothetical protein